VVPRLSLPLSLGGATPASTATRRSLAHTAADQRGSARGGTGGSDRGGEANALALQRLGYACGQSAMCADLAAFVAHKQVCVGGPAAARRPAGLASTPGPAVAAGPAAALAPSGGAGLGLSSDSETGCSESEEEGSWVPGVTGGEAAQLSAWAAASGPPRCTGLELWRALPEPLQVKLLLLACLGGVAGCYAAAGCAPPVAPVHLLVSELLVPEDDMRQLCLREAKALGRGGGSGGALARPPDAGVAAGVAALRRRSIQVVAAFGRLLSSGGAAPRGGDDTLLLDTRPKPQDDVVAALRQRLARLLGQDRDAMRGRCRARWGPWGPGSGFASARGRPGSVRGLATPGLKRGGVGCGLGRKQEKGSGPRAVLPFGKAAHTPNLPTQAAPLPHPHRADPAVLRACCEPLLVLHRYLAAVGAPELADAVVSQAQEQLVRLEHLIRGVQVRPPDGRALKMGGGVVGTGGSGAAGPAAAAAGTPLKVPLLAPLLPGAPAAARGAGGA
jgi:hypothetical protein